MPTANYVIIDGQAYSPKHRKALDLLHQLPQNVSNPPEGVHTTPKPSKRLKQRSAHENSPICEVSDSEPQRHQKAALECPVSGAVESLECPVVRFIGCRVRPLDPDNFAGSVKDLLDGLCKAGLLDGDEPWKLRLETTQIKVRHFKEEQTLIEIDIPNPTGDSPPRTHFS